MAQETPGPPELVELPTIPGYRLLRILGRGTAGVVYCAHHERLNRPVALKMLRAGWDATPKDRQRFETEAQAVARLQHVNIVQIYEIGELDGEPYFTLEYVEGGTLATRLDGTPWPDARAAELIETLARAMHYAHERGVVHRDLKPANILLATDGTPKIADFSVAKLGGGQPNTRTGAVLGTPSYMAPEQAGGFTKYAGPPADVHALGAILYELLTGKAAFKTENRLRTLQSVLLKAPEPLRAQNPQVDADLEAICLKCLRKDPAQRYASALDLADDLRRFRGGKPVQARPLGWRERLWRWCHRGLKQAPRSPA